MAQQKDYKVLVVQKVVVPDFAFYKNIGWGILTAIFSLVCGNKYAHTSIGHNVKKISLSMQVKLNLHFEQLCRLIWKKKRLQSNLVKLM